jgi:hypothetical protein
MDGNLVRVIGVRQGPAKQAPAYSLTVADLHTYYVIANNGMILGGHHRWDELQTRIDDGRIDSDIRIRI